MNTPTEEQRSAIFDPEQAENFQKTLAKLRQRPTDPEYQKRRAKLLAQEEERAENERQWQLQEEIRKFAKQLFLHMMERPGHYSDAKLSEEAYNTARIVIAKLYEIEHE